ncbi:DUF4177 domain-containing protein [Falsirhodobacter deserti]|uniref:DUF4177 domain-containing protein n=1 Tax=Falsirhodobacter deserti TaxID=1365611 RepID=UPI000FE2D318|nr:DUF4177 domain-containing protein [Falsirhodobacter deserti]
MTRFEYQVIPAPAKGEKARGVRSAAERFSLALAGVMNRMGRDGWEYVRAESLPAEDKSGWMRRTVTVQHVLVFRRPVSDHAPAIAEHAAANGPALTVANPPEGAPRPIGPARQG